MRCHGAKPDRQVDCDMAKGWAKKHALLCVALAVIVGVVVAEEEEVSGQRSANEHAEHACDTICRGS